MLSKNRTDTSIKRSFLRRFIWGTFIAWLVLSLFSYKATQHEIEELYDGEMAQIGRVLLSIYTSELDINSSTVRITASPFEGGQNYERKLVFQIWSKQGKLLLRSANAPLDPITKTVDTFETTTLYGNDARTLAVWDPTGHFLVQIGQNLVIRRENVTEILSFLLYILLIALPFSIWLINRGLNKSIQPLNDLSNKIASRAEHDLSPFEINHTPSELKGIVKSLNKLMAQVDGTLEHERQFMSDAAHELRTPLAGIKAHAQVALKNKQHQHDALKSIVKGVDRTSRLASQLLTLSGIDDIRGIQSYTLVNVKTLIESVIGDLNQNIRDKNIHLTTEFDTSINLKGDQALLGILLGNLLDNAIRYSPHSSEISISMNEHRQVVSVSITDQGPGISPDKYDRVFDRFYRDVNTGESGSGLGLAISRKIAILHQAEIHLGKPEQRDGLMVTLLFKQQKHREQTFKNRI